MIDLSPLKDYIIQYNTYLLLYAETRINKLGFDEWFNTELNQFLDCSRISSTGRRMIQTNLNQYKLEITIIDKLIEKYASNKDYYYEKLLELHNANLEFEAIHGLEYDASVWKKYKQSTKKVKKEPTIFDDKPKKRNCCRT